MSDNIKQLIFVAVLIIVIFLIVLLIVKLKSNNNNNSQTKNKRFNRKIRKYAKGRDFLFLSDVFLPLENNRAILIDNIIFGNKYIYVVAQKHWSGYLKGFEYDTKWLLTNKNQTNYVDNPLIGNRFRVETLLRFLKEKDDESVINIIAINDKVKFDGVKALPFESVTKMNGMFKIIDEYEKTSTFNDFKEEEIERIANLIYEESKKLSDLQRGR